MPDTGSLPPYEIQLDLYVARRKRIHAIFDPAGIPVFHDPLIMQVLAWLAEKDVTHARFTDDTNSFDVEFHRTTPGHLKPGE